MSDLDPATAREDFDAAEVDALAAHREAAHREVARLRSLLAAEHAAARASHAKSRSRVHWIRDRD